jgi:hypothetical protein
MERICPAPDVFATCPSDGKILEYYKDTFEAVYVLLHPFIKAVSIGKEQFNPGTYPGRSSIVANCAPVTWKDVCRKADLPSISAVDIGLRTRILGLKEEFRNQEYAAKIDSLIDSDDILPPPEGSFSDLLHDTVLASIQNLGYQWVWVGDEFCTERKLYWIDDLKGQEAGPTGGHCNVFTPDKALLWTTHWDSHFSFFCSSKAHLDSALRYFPFEGFFCDPSTEIYWSVWPSVPDAPSR